MLARLWLCEKGVLRDYVASLPGNSFFLEARVTSIPNLISGWETLKVLAYAIIQTAPSVVFVVPPWSLERLQFWSQNCLKAKIAIFYSEDMGVHIHGTYVFCLLSYFPMQRAKLGSNDIAKKWHDVLTSALGKKTWDVPAKKFSRLRCE